MKIVRIVLVGPVAIVMVCAILAVYTVVTIACGLAEFLDRLLER